MLIKRLLIILLSLLFVHGNIAWAFAACLHRDHHSNHATSGHHHSDFKSSTGDDDPQDPSVAVIHCASLVHQIGPAVQVTSASLKSSSVGFLLQQSLFLEMVPLVFANNLWLEALFKRIVTFPLPIDLSRHLFLSVLRI